MPESNRNVPKLISSSRPGHGLAYYAWAWYWAITLVKWILWIKRVCAWCRWPSAGTPNSGLGRPVCNTVFRFICSNSPTKHMWNLQTVAQNDPPGPELRVPGFRGVLSYKVVSLRLQTLDMSMILPHSYCIRLHKLHVKTQRSLKHGLLSSTEQECGKEPATNKFCSEDNNRQSCS